MENLQRKTKKMSLANIENSLTPAQMEGIMAGSGINYAACAVCGVAAVVMSSGVGFIPGLFESYSCFVCYYSL